jgi:hypothetical protein
MTKYMLISQIFKQLLSLHRDTKHSTPDCTVTEHVQSFSPIERVVTKHALLMDPDRRTLTYVTLKSWSNQKPIVILPQDTWASGKPWLGCPMFGGEA